MHWHHLGITNHILNFGHNSSGRIISSYCFSHIPNRILHFDRNFNRIGLLIDNYRISHSSRNCSCNYFAGRHLAYLLI